MCENRLPKAEREQLKMHDDARTRGAPVTDETYKGEGPVRGARLVARLVSRRRRAEIAARLAAGRAQRVAALELLAPEKLRDLAQLSFALLIAGGAGFWTLQRAAA